MATQIVKMMLPIMKLKDEAACVVVSKNSQGIITIDDLSRLSDKSVEGIIRVLRIPGGNNSGLSDHGVAVSAMAESNLQGIIYHINHFKIIGSTLTHIHVEFSKVHTMYHQRDMEEDHKDPELVPTVDPRDWPKTMEIMEEYIRGFLGVDGQPFSYGLRDYFIAPVTTSDTMYRANISE